MPSPLRRLAPVLVLLAAACADGVPTEPAGTDRTVTAAQRGPGDLPDVVSEVMALPQTVFGGVDDETGRLVFGVEHAGVIRGVRTALERRGYGPDAYRVRITEPIHFASTLRDAHRPTTSGLQINFGQYVCTLGFSVDHSGGRSFITNSHCTDQQGSTGSTLYYQPLASTAGGLIGVEADDPAYSKNGCSRGKKCRYSDASRAVYAAGIDSDPVIPLTAGGVNSGDLAIQGSLAITAQDDVNRDFTGTVHKVGRTTGWTSGGVVDSCVTVNVSGSNIQLLCQTLVENPGARIVAGGDSGSPVFRPTGGGEAVLLGILWGGSSSGNLFVFSPLQAIQDELGPLTATTSGTGGGGGTDPGDGGGGGGSDCPPNSNAPRCR